jgi:hypothetical protein
VFILIYSQESWELRKKILGLRKEKNRNPLGGAGKIKNWKKEFDLVELF